MARRRRNQGEKRVPYEDAFRAINKMEQAVAYRTVICEFTARNVMEWLWPSELLDLLERAAKETTETISSHRCDFEAIVPCGLSLPPIAIVLYFNLLDLKILPPLRKSDPDDRCPQHKPIVSALNELWSIYHNHNVVRNVIRWLNDHKVTPGAALEMFPSIRALLPMHHPIYQLQGQRRREPEFYPEAEMVRYMREGQATVAAGLLADPQNLKIDRKMLGVTLEKSVSQRFMLL